MLVSFRNKRVKEGERNTRRIMSLKLRKHFEICCAQFEPEILETRLNCFLEFSKYGRANKVFGGLCYGWCCVR